jgi:hypothetical protein
VVKWLTKFNRLLLIRRVLWRKLQYSCWWRCVPWNSFIKSVYLTTWSIVRIIQRRTLDRAVKNWTDIMWLWPSLNYYPVKCLARSRKSMKNINQDSSSPGHIFSPRPAGQQWEHKPSELQVQLLANVDFVGQWQSHNAMPKCAAAIYTLHIHRYTDMSWLIRIYTSNSVPGSGRRLPMNTKTLTRNNNLRINLLYGQGSATVNRKTT